jgi:uncharacterized membrane protein YfcA
MAEISRILTAVGLVAASTGLTLYGIGVAFVEPGGLARDSGIFLMIAGVIAAVIGIVMSKQIPEEE